MKFVIFSVFSDVSHNIKWLYFCTLIQKAKYNYIINCDFSDACHNKDCILLLFSLLFQMPVTIKNVHFYTLIQKAKFVIVRGTTEVSAGTDPRVDTDTCGEYCA